jgi:glycosyltransferase involved in cell wall biosynthesis
LKIAVLTTSYPRFDGDVAGRFVADAVEHVRERGVTVDVVAPERSFRNYGIAYGEGVVGNLRAAPWRGALLPPFLAGFVRAARRAARDADVVHAHWLPAGAVALATRKPVVLQLWGTDVELASRAQVVARPVVGRARVVVCASSALADAARKLGAREVRVIPSGVALPESVEPEAEPAHVLFAGRLSEEKGVLDFLRATEGLPRVVVGDGPLRGHAPEARGFFGPEALGREYGHAAVVAVPSHREGFGVVCAEAMAHGRPVVASAVGGLLDLVVDGETGLVVPPRDVAALRRAIERLLGDPDLRRGLGEAARERARDRLGWDAATDALLDAYRFAL